MTLRFDRAAGRRERSFRVAFQLRRKLILGMLILLAPLLMAAEYQTHTVKKGDTLYSISKRYGVSLEQIKQLNQLPDNRLNVSQVLKIKELPPTQAPPPTISSEQPASPPPAYGNLPEDYYYTVKAKDNLYRIALNNQLALEDLLRWNGFANEQHVIHPGDRMLVKDPASALAEARETANTPHGTAAEAAATAPADSSQIVSKIYVVQKKDTLYHIATINGMTVDELKRLNNLTSNQISVGQRLLLAGSADALASTGSSLTEEELKRSDKIRGDLIMPLKGVISSEFGLRNGKPHKGMDIAAKSGTPIYAVLDGVVVYSGVQSGYGNVVVIEHPDFVMTVYAHNERNAVRKDEEVKQGQIIAYVGSTGQSTGPHCHFEYRLKGKAINPRKVLPL